MRLLLIALLGAGLVPAASASHDWENVTKIKPGTRVEVVAADQAAKGEFIACSTESLTIRTGRGEQRFARPEVIRVVSLGRSRRLRNALIGGGVGVAVALTTDKTLGSYLHNESNLDARPLIWILPIALGAGLGAAFPSHPVVYRK